MALRPGNLQDSDPAGDLPGTGIGLILRHRREDLGLDIETVARQLRIRAVYIRAIEEGRLYELPGSAYAVGFVRAYADFMGLDGNSIVGDYRDELARRSRQNDLIWPTEGTKSRFPISTIIVICILLALGVYGGWYYASQSGGGGVSLISPVPDSMKPGTVPAEQTETAATNPPAAAPESGTATPPESQTATAPAETQTPAAPPPAAVIATPSTDAAASTAGTTTPPAIVLDVPAGSQASVADANAPTAQPQADRSTQEPAPAAPATDDTTVTTAAGAPTDTGSETMVPVATAPGLVIRAKRDSWIEIRDAKNSLLFQRVLRQGEAYTVPEQKGLVMTTGNAGGITIEFNGRPLSVPGALGVVMRGIKLDPQSLSDGSAFTPQD